MFRREKKAAKDTEYRRLGKTLSKVLVNEHLNIAQNWRRFIWLSFVRGIFIGLGGVIGATLVLWILLWVLSGFDQVPLIGDLFENIKETIENNRN